MPDRYEARVLSEAGRALTLWGAWDTQANDWVRRLGTGVLAGKPEVFTSEMRVQAWAARQPGSAPKEREHLDLQGPRQPEQVV